MLVRARKSLWMPRKRLFVVAAAAVVSFQIIHQMNLYNPRYLEIGTESEENLLPNSPDEPLLDCCCAVVPIADAVDENVKMKVY